MLSGGTNRTAPKNVLPIVQEWGQLVVVQLDLHNVTEVEGDASISDIRKCLCSSHMVCRPFMGLPFRTMCSSMLLLALMNSPDNLTTRAKACLAYENGSAPLSVKLVNVTPGASVSKIQALPRQGFRLLLQQCHEAIASQGIAPADGLCPSRYHGWSHNSVANGTREE